MLALTWRGRCGAGNLMHMRSAEATRLFANGRVWTGVTGAGGADITETTVAAQQGRIAAVGSLRELQERYAHAEVVDLAGRLVTPGLIDCHTHIVHGGNRAAEIERRLAGESYQSIARAGGGVFSPAAGTRAAGLQQLIEGAPPRGGWPPAGGGAASGGQPGCRLGP